ncbi:MAG: serpin family protein [Dactylosporangium sp.]|nr:serpin family protein [Dactylosporangium sp.]
MAVPLSVAAMAWGARRPLILDPRMSLVERAEPDPAAIAAAAGAVRGFTADMYRDLALTGDERNNLVCSPYSAVMALAMARAGAAGVTAQEMDTVLHAPTPRPQALDAGLNALDQLLVAAYHDPGGSGEECPRLDTANALWTQYDLPLEEAFLGILARYYGAGANSVDFWGATEAARQEINAWVSARTNERIPELLAQGALTPMTCLVLTNAIYLKANWQFPFPEEATEPAAFARDDGGTVSVPMMASPTNDIGYLSGGDWRAVDLPYVGSGLAMAIVVPEPGALASLEQRVDERWLRDLLTGFVQLPVRVRLPRWTFRLPTELGDLLARLGMPTAFSALADFSGMSSAAGLSISKVVHEAFIAVDEYGTEAAAATAVIIDRTAIGPTVVADRPFLFVIHDVATATPIFIGRVTDPTIEQ